MKIKDFIGFLCIAAGITIAILGIQEHDFSWIAGGVLLAVLGGVLVRLGRRDPDGIDAADALIDGIDD